MSTVGASGEQIYIWFVEHGYHLTYRSTAIWLLAHADLPGVEVRIGTVYVVVERDGKEVYRSLSREFNPADVSRQLFSGVL